MTDNQPTDRHEAFPGDAKPDGEGTPQGDVYGAGLQTGATPADAARTSGATQPTGVSSPGSYDAGSSGSRSSGVGGTAKDEAKHVGETAKDEAKHVGETAKDAGRQVVGTAKDEVKNVAGEAKAQARQLLDQTMDEAKEQAKTQQHRAAEGMHTFGEDLRGMADGAEGGLAAQLVSEVGDRASTAGSWLTDREPADVLDEVKSFARRRPGTFIAIAGVAGLLVGRLARGMVSEAKDERDGSTGGEHGARQRETTDWNAPTAASGAATTAAGNPYRDTVVPGGTAFDGDLPAQTGFAPRGTGLPTPREDGL